MLAGPPWDIWREACHLCLLAVVLILHASTDWGYSLISVANKDLVIESCQDHARNVMNQHMCLVCTIDDTASNLFPWYRNMDSSVNVKSCTDVTSGQISLFSGYRNMDSSVNVCRGGLIGATIFIQCFPSSESIWIFNEFFFQHVSFLFNANN